MKLIDIVGTQQRVAARYDELLQDVHSIETPYRAPDRTHIFHQHTIRVLDGRKDVMRDYLKEPQGSSSPARWLGGILATRRASFQYARARMRASVLC